ncbi:DUF2513 domain-containing protein [Vannielia litorea]|uniref:DUF2513 domain-containing protein n=1 Tax=Vannielia litorea TaxID=1217970 RepID=UPI001C956D16|nr:DUF2513 domain-containing protein [Vannielia litorea]MBY6154081.1 DUF2513 domain-containing protein [Vannielia litorea]
MPERDPELIRTLLLRAEGQPLDSEDPFTSGIVDFLNEVSPVEAYHLILMRDAGLITGKDANLGLFRITSAGHDFLDAIKDEGIWQKTKSVVAETGGSATIELIKNVAVGFLRKKLQAHMGIEL